MIKPTINRSIWYYPRPTQDDRKDPSQPLAAYIIRVFDDHLISIAGWTQEGVAFSRLTVALLQEGDNPPYDKEYCTWMPYQIGQAKANPPLSLAKTPPTEAELAAVAKGPRITKADLEALIVQEGYYGFPGTTTTVCCLVLANGFSVVGSSACASPENFNTALGERLAYQDAFSKLWLLEGYRLKCELANKGA